MKFLSTYFVLLFFLVACSPQVVEVDILFKNGTILDGSGNESFVGDLGITADTIVFVKKGSAKARGKLEFEAAGYVVAPGFIDPHTHATRDLSDPDHKANLNYLHQGVTTVFIGNDGRSATDLNAQYDLWERQGIGTNAASYVGHGSTRQLVMGMRNEAPTQEELNNMKTLVRRGMEAGALGLSGGLYYAPGSYASTEEVIELAKIAAEYGGVYDVHMRDESSYNIGLINAVKETIRIAEEGGLPGHIAHIKCLGVDVWGQSNDVIGVIEEARGRGVRITADQYPYRASGTSITGALVPRWVLANDDPSSLFRDENQLSQIIPEMTENLRRRGGASTLLLTAPSEKNADLKGMYLNEVADKWKMQPVQAAIELFLNGGSSVASFNMTEGDIREFMRQKWVMTGSDGSHGHPRKYGSFSKKMKEYVLDKKVLSLKDMVRQSSGLTAETFGIAGRGLLKEGFFADIIVFKPEEVMDHATFEEPTNYASGMNYVLVNGKVAIDKGQFNGTLPGKGLRKKQN